METIFRLFLAPVLAAAAVLAIYFGAYAPYEKAALFVNAVQASSKATTLQEFKNDFNTALDFYSPIGQQEVQRFTGETIISIVDKKGTAPGVSQALVDYLNGIIHIDRPTDRGLDFTREYFLLADAYRLAWTKCHNPNDFAMAKKYYQGGLKLSPRRPQLLYGLLRLYAKADDTVQALRVAEKLHEYWPQDSKMACIIPELKKDVDSSLAVSLPKSTSTRSGNK